VGLIASIAVHCIVRVGNPSLCGFVYTDEGHFGITVIPQVLLSLDDRSI
jgi:hypothetical protein